MASIKSAFALAASLEVGDTGCQQDSPRHASVEAQSHSTRDEAKQRPEAESSHGSQTQVDDQSVIEGERRLSHYDSSCAGVARKVDGAKSIWPSR